MAGYHYYVDQAGNIHTLRPIRYAGAHCLGHNRISIAVCYEGGLDAEGRAADTRTPDQRIALRELLSDLRQRYPLAEIVGHRDLSPDLDGDGLIRPYEWIKACPCFDARKEYERL